MQPPQWDTPEALAAEPIMAERVMPDGDGDQVEAGLAIEATSPMSAEEIRNRSRQRWWTPLAVAAVSLASFIFASSVMAIVALLVVHGSISARIVADPESMKAVSESRLGLFLVIVIPQIALVMPSLVAAYLSPVPFRQRLSLVRGHWPVWTWLAVAAATPLVGLVSGLVVGMFLEESDTLKAMTDIFRRHGQNGFLFPLALMIGATPAICEEILFRGYIQTRLTQAFSPLLGVGAASFLFAAFHLDPVHVVAVFPLGVYLGWVTWQCGSLFPAMLAHFVNNAISVVGVVVAPEENAEMLALPAVAFTMTILAMGLIGMAVVSVVAIAYRRREPGSLAVGETGLA